jgi:AraC family transcriptional regulator of adaptative response/methylated-DNA-[protein]-cysteine methyltransferase
MTPKDYAGAHRAKKIHKRTGLPATSSPPRFTTRALIASFYEKSIGLRGMTPSQYRFGGAYEEIRFAIGQTSLANMGHWSRRWSV